MGKLVLLDAFIEVDAVDLSDHASAVAIEMPDDEVDLSAFGSIFRETGRGAKDASVTVTFFQDTAVGSVNATLWPISQSGAPVPVVVRQQSAVVSATNPEWTMTGSLFNYSPISGSYGEASTTDVTFRNASQLGVVQTVV